MIVDWDVLGGVNYVDNDGDPVYEYVIKVPDAPEVSVGDCYTPVYYDASMYHGTYIPGLSPSMDAATFCIGEPYRPLTDYEMETDWINAVFTYADQDRDGCVTFDEMNDLQ